MPQQQTVWRIAGFDTLRLVLDSTDPDAARLVEQAAEKWGVELELDWVQVENVRVVHPRIEREGPMSETTTEPEPQPDDPSEPEPSEPEPEPDKPEDAS